MLEESIDASPSLTFDLFFLGAGSPFRAASNTAVRGFGKGGYSLFGFFSTKSIVQKAVSKEIKVDRVLFETNNVVFENGQPKIILNYFASTTAAIEEYLQARIVQRSLAKGISQTTLESNITVLEEEIYVKSRLIAFGSGRARLLGGNPIPKFDVRGLSRTLDDYKLRYEIIKRTSPDKTKFKY